MKVGLLIVTLAVLPLAGCLGNDGSTQEVGPEEPAIAAQVEYVDCLESGAVVPIPADEVGPLPEGFVPMAFDDMGATVALVALTLTCVDSLAGEATGPVSETIALLPVSVPEAYQTEAATSYSVLLAGIMDNEALHHVYEAWGFGNESFTVGSVTVDAWGAADVANAARGVADDGKWRVETSAGLVGPSSAGEPGAGRGFVVDAEGALVAVVDYSYGNFSAAGQGAGTVTVQGGPLPSAAGGFGFQNSGFTQVFEWVPLSSIDVDAEVEAEAATEAPALLWRGLPALV